MPLTVERAYRAILPKSESGIIARDISASQFGGCPARTRATGSGTVNHQVCVEIIEPVWILPSSTSIDMDKLEARIIITHGHRSDCKSTIDVYDVKNNKFQKMGIVAGPLDRDIRREVNTLRNALERAGNHVTIVVRRK